ncbi:dual specificity protein phosphatase 13A-like [Paramormyrops kingsleyae]|uniref:Dual specificity protein phosphatase n=1 Tax=Paramormyrops kingsleyae TaxID=1676925 RepID=A0A3B3SH28_9TELE|nr:dual specificity protein phosphatase 13-like [Paramormyrops kingsleyae]
MDPSRLWGRKRGRFNKRTLHLLILSASLLQLYSLMTSTKNTQFSHCSVKELENILDTCILDLTPADEIWPNLLIGNVATAQNRGILQEMGITHVLNAAHSKQGSIGQQQYYGSSIKYWGVPAEDTPHFDLSVYFRPAAEFIHKALRKKDSKVLVHCIMGISRSATLVLAYLMLYHHLTLLKAIEVVIKKRAIYPNRNFLAQLVDLDTRLRRKRRLCPIL